MKKAATEAQPRSRRPHPKTRTGCDTCRKRRVKCGEEKPKCIKCITFGTSCSYMRRKGNSGGPRHHALVPLLRPQVSSHFKFDIDDALCYFELFQTKTSFQILSQTPEVDSLRRIWLQSSTVEPSILHGLAALGALEAATDVISLTHQYDNHWNTSNRHQQNALKLYSRAISHMKDSASQGEQDLRTTLLNCLVTIGFESWTGNRELALKQMQTGVGLIQEWKASPTSRQSDSSSYPTSTTEAFIEEEIVQVFVRIAVQVIAITTHNTRSAACQESLRRDGTKALVSMPARFSSLKEAGFYQSIIFRTAMDLIINRIPKHIDANEGRTWPFRTDPKEELKNGFPEYDNALAYIRKWSDGFEVLSKSWHGKRSSIAVTAAILKLQIISAHVTLVGILAADEMVYDGMLKEFGEVVALAELVLSVESAPTRSAFCFDLGPIYGLAGSAAKCRSPGIRRQAIALLLRSARREGVWDSLLFGKMMEWHANVEENFLENGQVPAWARISGLKMTSSDLQSRTASLSCQQRKSASSSELVTRLKTITW